MILVRCGKLKIKYLTVLLAVAVMFAGCRKTESPGEVIHIATAALVKTLDPALADDL